MLTMSKLHVYNHPVRGLELVYAKIRQTGLNIMPTKVDQENILDYNPCPAQADRFNLLHCVNILYINCNQ